MNFIKKIWDYCKGIIFISIGAVITCLLLEYMKINPGKLDDNDFMFTFLGILLGISLTIYTFIIGLIQNIRDKISNSTFDINKKKSIDPLIKNLSKEITEDILFIFQSLVIISFVFIIENSNFYLIDESFFSIIFNKARVITGFRISIFFFNMLAIYDLIKSAFKLSIAYSML